MKKRPSKRASREWRARSQTRRSSVIWRRAYSEIFARSGRKRTSSQPEQITQFHEEPVARAREAVEAERLRFGESAAVPREEHRARSRLIRKQKVEPDVVALRSHRPRVRAGRRIA